MSVCLLMAGCTSQGSGGREARSLPDLALQGPPGRTRHRVRVEDLSQSWFRETALARMREQFVPGAPPVLLLDLDGAAREALGVEEGVSVVLVYDAGGALVHVERGEPDRGRAEQAWKALAAAGDT